jgi:16S rRNA (guanine527-N7)-methyltransferase
MVFRYTLQILKFCKLLNDFMASVIYKDAMAHKNSSNWSPYKASKNKSENNSRNFSKNSEVSASRATEGTNNTSSRKVNASGPLKDPKKFNPNSKSNFSKPAPIAQTPRARRVFEEYSFQEADDRIYDVFRNHGFADYPHEKRLRLTKFYQLLMESQKEFNFTRITNIRDAAIKHFIDSIIPANLTKIRFPLLDMGSGPGFPGIPLRIHFDHGQIILGEGVQRRVDFLKEIRTSLNLKELDIMGRNINHECFYPVQTVITRAVEDARNTIGNVIHSLQTGGEIILMKGPNCEPEIDMALKAWGKHFELSKDIFYELPNTDNRRRLLIFKKIKPFELPDFEDLDLAWEVQVGDIKASQLKKFAKKFGQKPNSNIDD